MIAFVFVLAAFAAKRRESYKCWTSGNSHNYRWCPDNSDVHSYMNICDGSYFDCMEKGHAVCAKDRHCHGIQWNKGWSSGNKGVKRCNSRTLKFKDDWVPNMMRPCGSAAPGTTFVGHGRRLATAQAQPRRRNFREKTYNCWDSGHHNSKWCKFNGDDSKYMNICDGSYSDCMKKGHAVCARDRICMGIQWHPKWSPGNKGVKRCNHRTLVHKHDGWVPQLMRPCPAGTAKGSTVSGSWKHTNSGTNYKLKNFGELSQYHGVDVPSWVSGRRRRRRRREQ